MSKKLYILNPGDMQDVLKFTSETVAIRTLKKTPGAPRLYAYANGTFYEYIPYADPDEQWCPIDTMNLQVKVIQAAKK